MKKEMLNDLVSVEIEENKHAIKSIGGKAFKIDTSYNEMGTDYAVQDGIVRSVPAHLTDKGFGDEVPEMRINVGDRVFCHHHIMEFGIVQDRIRMIPYHLVYCTVNDDKINMLDPWNLLVPVDSMVKSPIKIARHEYQMAKVEHASPSLIKQGIDSGDTVIYRPGADCELKIDGKYYFRVVTRHVIAKIV